jgi:hypothetical protein
LKGRAEALPSDFGGGAIELGADHGKLSIVNLGIVGARE